MINVKEGVKERLKQDDAKEKDWNLRELEREGEAGERARSRKI